VHGNSWGQLGDTAERNSAHMDVHRFKTLIAFHNVRTVSSLNYLIRKSFNNSCSAITEKNWTPTHPPYSLRDANQKDQSGESLCPLHRGKVAMPRGLA
jgi:hypothetical protein